MKRLAHALLLGALLSFFAAPSALAATRPVIEPGGALLDLSPVRVSVKGLMIGETYELSICDGRYSDRSAPDCDLDPNFSRSFYATKSSFSDSFPVRKSYSTVGKPDQTFTCKGDANAPGSYCYMVIYRVGTYADSSATPVRFR